MRVLAPGTILQDRYRIVRQIGQGGMGAVYEAVQERLKRHVAVKQLLIVGEARRDRAFLREAQILANLEHPSLPDVIDFFTDDAGHFLVMDFVPGDDLALQLAKRGQPFSTETVIQWADQVLDVLHYLHTQPAEPIYHGDIKPHNLKPKLNGDIMVLDFGLAKGYLAEMSHAMGESSIVGYTPGFSPPEQVEGAGVDARSDLYALGATLHRLLTNTPPVDERSRWRAVARGHLDPLRPAHELNTAVSIALSAVLVQALSLEPEGRPTSAAAMRAALQDARRGVIVQVLPMSAMPPPTYTDEPTVVDASAIKLLGDDVSISDSLTAVDAAHQTVDAPPFDASPDLLVTQSTDVTSPWLNEPTDTMLPPVVDSPPVDASATVAAPLSDAPPVDEAAPVAPPASPTWSGAEQMPIVIEASQVAAQPADSSKTFHDAAPTIAQVPALPGDENTLNAGSAHDQHVGDAGQERTTGDTLHAAGSGVISPSPHAADAGGPTLVSNVEPASLFDQVQITDHPSVGRVSAGDDQLAAMLLADVPQSTPDTVAEAASLHAQQMVERNHLPVTAYEQTQVEADPRLLAKPIVARRHAKQNWWLIGSAALLGLLVVAMGSLRGFLFVAPMPPIVQPTVSVEAKISPTSAGSQIAEAITAAPALPLETAVPSACSDDQSPVPETRTAADLRETGLAALNAGRYDEAIREYTWALKLDSRSADAYTRRGQAYHKQRKYDCAISDYSQALELDPAARDPNSAVAYTYRGNAYANQQEDRNTSDYTQAIDDYSRAITLTQQLNLLYAAPYKYRGSVYALQGEDDRAIEDYTLAIAIYDQAIAMHGRGSVPGEDYAEAFWYRGLSHKHQGTIEQAIADFQKVREVSKGALRQKAQEQLDALLISAAPES